VPDPRNFVRRSGGRIEISELVVGVVLLALAAVIFLDARRLAPGSIYGVGPSVAPMMVAGGFVLLGIATVLSAWRKRGDAEEEGGIDRAAIVVIVAALAAAIALMTLGGGFVLACTVLFAGTAWAFGRRAPAADVVIGLVLALLVYAAFTRALTLALPEGPFEKLVQRGLDPLVRALHAIPWPW
jgi:putative tricarboxylic transport membrane protein